MSNSIIEGQTVATTETLNSSQQNSPINLQPNKSWFSLFSLALGFLGIQFAYTIQLTKTTPIMESLGSAAWLTGWIWCAGPVTGVLVQPLIGALSDKTWTFLGRRRPYVLAGALLTAICLIAMPNVSGLAEGFQQIVQNIFGVNVFSWLLEGGQPAVPLLFAAILLWILDASVNTSQGPYRALVPDTIPKGQQAATFALMSLMIGLGAVIASALSAKIDTVTLCYWGAFAVVGALIWTSLTTPEHRYVLGKPMAEQMPQKTTTGKGVMGFFKTTLEGIVSMPPQAKRLCLAHSFTWFGLMCMFVFLVPYVAYQVYGATGPGTDAYKQGEQLVGMCYMYHNIACVVFSALIKPLTQVFGKKAIHTFGLLCLGVPLVAMTQIQDPNLVLICMTTAGIGWATTLSLPFALLADHIPAGNEGALTGAFNIFIAAPQFIASPLVGLLVTATQWHASALLLGGSTIIISALLLQRVQETKTPQAQPA